MSDRSVGVPTKVLFVAMFVIAAIVGVTFAASLNSGFYSDDFVFLEYVGQSTPIDYLVQVFDPRTPIISYRPAYRVLLLIEYSFFHFEPSYYHLVQVLFHWLNCILLFLIIERLSKQWRVGIIAAIFYAGLPIDSDAVAWISDPGPLATLFYLAAIWLWILFLQTKRFQYYLFTVTALVIAFLSKETTVTAPIILFLIDRWIIRDSVTKMVLIRRYAVIIMVWLAFGFLEYVFQSNGVFVKSGGYSVGMHIIQNFFAYVAMLVSPWGTDTSTSYWSILIVGLFALVTFLKRSAFLGLLGIIALLSLAPVLGIPWGVLGRYLYLTAIVPAIIVAMIIEYGWITLPLPSYKFGISIAISGLALYSGLNVATGIDIFSEIARQQRVPFRDIMRQHPTFPNDTFLFFVDPPALVSDVGGMFFQWYGRVVSVGGTFEEGTAFAGGTLRTQYARLRDHALTYVYYFDETKRPIEIRVTPDSSTLASLELPVNFAAPIRLETYELTASTVHRGDVLVLLLYWRAIEKIDRDYTVFVHLLDAQGRLVAGEDGMPRNGKERTSRWRTNQLTADAHVIPIPPEAPLENGYRLEVGLYFLPDLERLSLLDETGRSNNDSIIISPLDVIQ